MGEPVISAENQYTMPADKELRSIVRNVGVDVVLHLMYEKYKIKEETSVTILKLVQIIEKHEKRNEIIGTLHTIKECCSSIHDETFLAFCDKLGVTGIVFNEPIKLSAMRCYIQKNKYFAEIVAFSAINKEKQFDVYGGKEIEKTIHLEEKHRVELESVLEDLVEKGRKYIINTTQINDEIIMSAHFEMRKRTFTTISNGDKVESITITPSTEAVARYDIFKNRLRVKGRSPKLKKHITEAFGKVFFMDNNHFMGDNHEVYKLDSVKEDKFTLELDAELQEEVVSAVIKEEVINVAIENDNVLLTVQGNDVEKALEYLSNENINLKEQPRKQVKIELVLKQSDDKTKRIMVTVSDNSKINFNPQYKKIVHKCLTKWGIEIGKE
ncbi:TPA: hypothetical protein QCY18_003616 [Bacillus cereus]|uniref:hypothetical protein n=1 Tax=Bacillus cereus group TaxID=86661 RepID=UPI0009B57114|nr:MULTISPECIES: hypothetical protein [Bacillus cereus group]MED2680492.1 hypothetical protein [Bacillus thuringiensis]MCC2484880.1 hypothetical protein [Bacillus pacificus]MDA1605204.1 hypothetical protein [Bacillus cereus group sp. TH208-1LC]MEB9078807.1 hypothetical protein [Bacillus cereus]MEC0000814.1 hypothetical protein [Bacillus cereus]